MTDSTGSWQPDPHGRHQYRYWDGTQWTDQVADDGVTSTDPADAGAAAPSAAADAAAPSDPAVPPTAPVPPVDPTTSWGEPSTDPGATTSMPLAGAAPAAGAAPKSSGNKPALIIGGLLLLALLGAGAYLIFGGDDDKDDAAGTTTETTEADVDDGEDDGDTTDTTQGDGLGGSISGNEALMDLFIQGVMQGSDLSEDQARCFSEEFFENEDLNLEELMADPDAMANDTAVMSAFLDIFTACDIDPTTLGGGTGTGSGITSTGQSYGDDPELDALWDQCEDGDGAACDDLYFNSPFGSEYEEFGDTCGGRVEAGTVFCEFEDLS